MIFITKIYNSITGDKNIDELTGEEMLRLYAKHKTFDACSVNVGCNRKTWSLYWYDHGLPDPKTVEKVDYEPETYKLMACSDLHLGSRQQCLTPFLKFVKVGIDQEIKTIVMPGDVCEGLMLRDGHAQLRFLHSIDEIYQYVYEVFAKFADDFEHVWLCLGNHDDSLNRRADGFNICDHLAKDFSSVEYKDDPDELMNPFPLEGGINGVMHHGTGGCQKNLVARTRTKTIDFINSNNNFSIVFAGHCHRFSSDYWLQKYAYSLGCFQSTTHFLASKGLTPDVRGDVISYNVDLNGKMRNVVDTPYIYNEEIKKNDY